MTGAVGFIGLGSMGAQLAANLVAAGHRLLAHDAAGPDRLPAGASWAPTVADVAAGAELVALSLPDGRVSEQVARELAAAPSRQTTLVLDTSTVGVQAAQDVASLLAEAGVGHVDAAVSGGVAGARARTLTVMYAGPPDAIARAQPVLAGLSNRRLKVGDRSGMAQVVKLANNFLAASALAATSEAVAFGEALGVDMATMLEVVNTSSGQSNASSEKFVRQVLPGHYAAGFANSLMAKDVRLYLEAVDQQDGPSAVARVTARLWERFAAEEPGADFTLIYPFLKQQ